RAMFPPGSAHLAASSTPPTTRCRLPPPHPARTSPSEARAPGTPSGERAIPLHPSTNGPVDFGRYAGPMPSERVNAELKRLPATPGVYLFRDEHDHVLYVGEGKLLAPSVRQYFQAGRSDNRMGMDALVSRVAHVETIVTGSEV